MHTISDIELLNLTIFTILLSVISHSYTIKIYTVGMAAFITLYRVTVATLF